MRYLSLLTLTALMLIGCSRYQGLDHRRAEIEPLLAEQVYFLQANASGHIISLSEIHRLEQRVAAGKVSEIVLFSFGWNTSMEEPEAYVEFLDFFNAIRSVMAEQTVELPRDGGAPALVIIMWDSSFHTFQRLFLDFLPSQGMANVLASVPDKALFPLSFWSKAALAEQLGHGDLRAFMDAMIDADPDDGTPLQFTGLGHSFGCRILAALLSSVNSEGEPIPGDRIRAMLFLQPAITHAQLPPAGLIDGPVVVTFSRNDNSLRLFFSLANMLFNNGLTDATMRAVRGSTDEGLDMSMEEAVMAPVVIGRGAMDMILTLIAIPFDYTLIQGQQILRSPGGWVMDSLAQLPLVSIPVDLTNGLHSGENWGTLRRGILQFGWVHDSVGSVPPLYTVRTRTLDEYSLRGAVVDMDVEHILPWRSSEIPTPPTITEVLESGMTFAPGIHHINATESIRSSKFLGLFDYNMNSWFGRHFLRVFDPVGAHTDISNPAVITLIDRTLRPPEDK